MSGIGARITCSAAAAVAVAGFTACGGDSPAKGGRSDSATIRVGETTIGKPTIAHWMAVMAQQHVVPVPPRYTACVARRQALAIGSTDAALRKECRLQYQALRTRALGFLISSHWLIGEAAGHGTAVTEQEVDRRLAEKKRSFANAAEFQESLDAIAHTPADLRFEIQAELIAERIRRRLRGGEPRVTPSEIAAYYRRHIASYHIPEKRYFDIGENFPSAAVAKRYTKAVGAGKESLHESLPRKPFTDYNGEKRIIYEAIFKARPHMVSEPIRLNSYYFLIDVTRITPAYVRSLAQVRGAIGRKLSSERRRRTLAAFTAAWRRRWIARTDCSAGYVVQKCRQYRGLRTPEDPLAFN